MTDKKDPTTSPTFCIIPYISIVTDPAGGYRACCWNVNNDQKFFGDVSEFKSSDYLKNMQETLASGVFPESCRRCRDEERAGVTNSRRIRKNKEFKHLIPDIHKNEFKLFDMRLSNLCNLGCTMCSSRASSFITNETANNFADSPEHFQVNFRDYESKDLLNSYTDADIDVLIDAITPGSVIYLAGGEPSLIKKVFRMLYKVRERGLNESISLEISSNFAAFNPKWFDLLKDFNGLMIPSIDGVGERAEWIRYPCKWEEVDRNVKTFAKTCRGFKITVLPAVSIMCLFGLKDIYSWIKEIESDVAINTTNKLFSPKYFDIRNLPRELKDQAIDYVDNIIINYSRDNFNILQLKDVKKFMEQEPNQTISEIVSVFDKFDKIRGLNWRKAMPELQVLDKYTRQND
jgi:sulfatase maturation enzyme AslB (radical SAM superfamily)